MTARRWASIVARVMEHELWDVEEIIKMKTTGRRSSKIFGIPPQFLDLDDIAHDLFPSNPPQ